MENNSTLEITKDNVLNWLRLLLQVYPLEPNERHALYRYLHRTDKMHVRKEIEHYFD